uniref:Uncharacterized protein n=1 Tax=Zea mays TaxID=4577 RepID=A0A804MSA7_MAIZE
MPQLAPSPCTPPPTPSSRPSSLRASSDVVPVSFFVVAPPSSPTPLPSPRSATPLPSPRQGHGTGQLYPSSEVVMAVVKRQLSRGAYLQKKKNKGNGIHDIR